MFPPRPHLQGPAGVVEQFAARRRTAVISGWTAGTNTSDVPKTVVITMHNWGLASFRHGNVWHCRRRFEFVKKQVSTVRLQCRSADTADFLAFV